MRSYSTLVSGEILTRLLDPDAGLAAAIARVAADEGVSLAQISPAQVFVAEVTLPVAEKLKVSVYPCVYVWVAGVDNAQREHGRMFSGTVSMVIQVRVSSGRLEGLARLTGLYGDAIAALVSGWAGDWGSGMYYGGRYKQKLYSALAGGSGLVQACSIQLPVEAGE